MQERGGELKWVRGSKAAEAISLVEKVLVFCGVEKHLVGLG